MPRHETCFFFVAACREAADFRLFNEMPDSTPPLVQLARHAMATRFEIVLPGDNAVALRAAGEEALDEIERLEAQLSLYRPTSEVAQLNARAASGPVRVEPGLFKLMAQAKALSQETKGLFDPTIGPLMRCWDLMGGPGRVPERTELESARALVGLHLVHLDPAKWTVHFLKPGVMLDFGALGKGYAIERAAQILRDLGINSALIHGGTSTAFAMGSAPDGQPWKVAIEYPSQGPEQPPELLAIVPLKDQALSVSAVWGKFFTADGVDYWHVMNPTLGAPVSNALLAAIVTPSATESDALSTALLAGGSAHHESIANLRPNMRTLLLERNPAAASPLCFAHGIETRKRGLEGI